MTVYIVDDEECVRRSLAFLLATDGVETRSFGSGPEFLEALATLSPGPVLLDLRMPTIGGIEVLKELRERQVQWPVVVITAHGEIAAAVQAIKLGALDLLEKPFSEELLQTCLRHAAAAIERSGAMDEAA